MQRIVLIDGPSVLGWERWRAICQSHVLGLIEGVLTQAAANGALLPLPTRPLAHLLLAVADEAALYLNASVDAVTARDEITQIVTTLIRGLVSTGHAGRGEGPEINPELDSAAGAGV